VHELIEFGVLNHGDRIGHGLAIGHSPELWSAGARVAYQPRGERMADLAWELDASDFRMALGNPRRTASIGSWSRACATRTS
jgi:hypothetical protein